MNDKSLSDNDNSNVVVLPVTTTLDIPAERVLDGAKAAEVVECIVVGYTDDAPSEVARFYFASTTCDAGRMLVMLERCRDHIMQHLILPR